MSPSTGPPSWLARLDADLSWIAGISAGLLHWITGTAPPPARQAGRHSRARRRFRRRVIVIQEELEEETES